MHNFHFANDSQYNYKTIKHAIIQKLDLIGFSASTICAIHCAIMPFIIVSLPLLGLEFIANPIIEFIILGLSLVIGLFTLRAGYFEHHGKLTPALLFVLGMSIVISGHFLFHDHANVEEAGEHFDEYLFFIIAPIGAMMIAYAHFINRKWTKTKCTHTHKNIHSANET